MGWVRWFGFSICGFGWAEEIGPVPKSEYTTFLWLVIISPPSLNIVVAVEPG